MRADVPLSEKETAVNIMGIGFSEMVVIFLVAFLVLGPNRSIGMARTAGKVLRDLRRTFSEVAAAAGLEQQEQAPPRWDSPVPDHKEESPPKTGDE